MWISPSFITNANTISLGYTAAYLFKKQTNQQKQNQKAQHKQNPLLRTHTYSFTSDTVLLC